MTAFMWCHCKKNRHNFKLPIATVYVQVGDVVKPFTGFLDDVPRCPFCHSPEVEAIGSLPMKV